MREPLVTALLVIAKVGATRLRRDDVFMGRECAPKSGAVARGLRRFSRRFVSVELR